MTVTSPMLHACHAVFLSIMFKEERVLQPLCIRMEHGWPLFSMACLVSCTPMDLWPFPVIMDSQISSFLCQVIAMIGLMSKYWNSPSIELQILQNLLSRCKILLGLHPQDHMVRFVAL